MNYSVRGKVEKYEFLSNVLLVGFWKIPLRKKHVGK